MSFPPMLLDKWARHSERYGSIHAFGSFAGRKSRVLWGLIGPAVTRSYVDRWLAKHSERLINIGSGSHRIPNMLNLDISPYADAYVDIGKRLPFGNDSIDGIFCEETIEHVDFQTALAFLKEALRVLRPGGVLRLTTPDIAYLLAGKFEDNEFFAKECGAMIGSDAEAPALRRVAVINALFYRHGHKFLYDRPALHALASAAGFGLVRKSRWRDAGSRLGRYDSHAERFGHPPDMSLYLDCEKSA